MNRNALWAIVAAVVLFTLVFVLRPKPAVPSLQSPAPGESSIGSYDYACGAYRMRMTPAPDMSAIHIAPIGGAPIPAMVLLQKPSTSGARYEANGIIFTAKGETVQLATATSTITCNPVQVPDQAPFNFGD